MPQRRSLRQTYRDAIRERTERDIEENLRILREALRNSVLTPSEREALERKMEERLRSQLGRR